jgi:hypothetical protein
MTRASDVGVAKKKLRAGRKARPVHVGFIHR